MLSCLRPIARPVRRNAARRITRRRTWSLAVVVVLMQTLFGAASSPAQTAVKSATECTLDTFGTGKVQRVIDGRTFRLDDGQHVRLAAVEVPAPPLPGESGPQFQAGLAAKAALEELLAGRTIVLKKLGP